MGFPSVLQIILMLAFSITTHLSLAGDPAEVGWAATINVAGRQRMLAQRAAKEAFQIFLDIEPKKSAEDLRKTMGLFEESLEKLARKDASLGLPPFTSAIVRQIGIEERTWKQMKIVLDKVLAGKGDIDELEMIDREVTREAQELVTRLAGSYNNRSDKPWGTILNLAGRQRMLSQQMAKDLFMVLLQANPEAHRSALGFAIEAFDQTLRGLMNGDSRVGLPPITDQQALVKIDAAGKAWFAFLPLLKKGLRIEPLSPGELKQVVALNLQLLEASDEVVSRLEELANRNAKP